MALLYRPVADKVQELRQNLGWNQATLAQQSDIPQATISRIENGKVTQPKMGQLHKLATALGTTIDYLAGATTVMNVPVMNVLKLNARFGVLYAVSEDSIPLAQVVESYHGADDLSCACGGGVSRDPYDRRKPCPHIRAVQAFIATYGASGGILIDHLLGGDKRE